MAIRMAILGCGGMAGAHARRFAANPDVEIVALCDVSPANIASLIARRLAQYPRPMRQFTDAAQMYREAKPDGVVIVTPHTMHFEHGMQALAAGCHVLMEKPMVTDAAQAHALAAEVARRERVLVVGYNSPCMPAMRYTREAIRDGRFGRLQLVSGWLSQDWKRLTAGSWRQKPEFSGGGQAYDSGAHIFNSLCWSVEADIAEVYAQIDRSGTPVDINSAATIRFANGVLATLVIGGDCAASGAGMVYCFEKGRIEVDGWGGEWIRVYAPTQLEQVDLPGTAQSCNDNFVDAILGRAEALTSARNGIIQSELMDALYASAASGQPARPARRAGAGA